MLENWHPGPDCVTRAALLPRLQALLNVRRSTGAAPPSLQGEGSSEQKAGEIHRPVSSSDVSICSEPQVLVAEECHAGSEGKKNPLELSPEQHTQL